jgi:hypothetical protein
MMAFITRSGLQTTSRTRATRAPMTSVAPSFLPATSPSNPAASEPQLYLATGGRGYAQRAIRIADWLVGDNPAGESMYHPRLGGCYDGILGHRINRNLGAESSIEAGRAELFRSWCEADRSLAA